MLDRSHASGADTCDEGPYGAVIDAAVACAAAESDEERKAKARALWAACSALPGGKTGETRDALYLPPFYGTRDTEELWESTVVGNHKAHRTDTGGSLAIQGVLGVGKSTLLRAATIHAVLACGALAAMWDFSEDEDGDGLRSPLCVLADALLYACECLLRDRGGRVWDTACAALAAAYDTTKSPGARAGAIDHALKICGDEFGIRGVVFMADEVNELYVLEPMATAEYVRGPPTRTWELTPSGAVNTARRAASHELLIIGKHRGWIGVASGSSSQLLSMLYVKSGHSLWKSAGYRDFNVSVYVLHYLYPIRDAGQLAAYCAARYPTWVPPDDLYDTTGGVGRYVEDVYVGRDVRYQNARRLYSALRDIPTLGRFVSLVVATEDSRAGVRASAGGVRAPLVMDSMTCEDKGISRTDVYRFEDERLVLCRDGRVELLCPHVLEVMQAATRRDEDARELHAFRTALYMFNGGSAGTASQRIVLRNLCPATLECELSPYYLRGKNKKLTVSGGELEADSGLLEFGLDKLAGQVVQRTSDTGLDGIVITKQEAEEDSYVVDVIQIKTGAVDERGIAVNYPAGDLDRERGRLTQADSKEGEIPLIWRVSDVKANVSVAGVIAKAEVGTAHLLQLLRASTRPTDEAAAAGAIAPTFKLRRAYLFTNRPLTEDAATLAATVGFGASVAGVPGCACTGLDVVSGDAYWDLMAAVKKRL